MLKMRSVHHNYPCISQVDPISGVKICSVSAGNSQWGSDAYISGHAEKLKIHANNGSDIHAYDLVSNFCIVESSDGGDVPITENKEISGNASGGSDIY